MNPINEYEVELRDRIAIAAMNGFLSEGMGFNSPWKDHFQSLAEQSYSLADAMLSARVPTVIEEK